MTSPPQRGLTLGIHDGHGAGAALAHDGRLLAAVSEERLTRRKRERGFPARAIAACLAIAGADPCDVERVVYATRGGRAGPRLLDAFYRRGDEGGGPLALAARIEARIENDGPRVPGWGALEASVSRAAVTRRIRDLGGIRRASVSALEHHRAHALAAAFGSASGSARCADDASGGPLELAVTLDGFGDGLAGSVSELRRTAPRGERLRRIAALPWTQSLGLVYGSVCQALGFSEGEEGQVTALAALGESEPLAGYFASLIRIGGSPGKGRGRLAPLTIERRLLGAALRRAVREHRPSDVARALQDRTEEAVTQWVSEAVARVGAKGRAVRLGCAGGLFANVRLAPALARVPGIEAVTVFPAMGDEGLCVGAALGELALDGETDEPACNGVYLGADLAEGDILRALAEAGLRADPPADRTAEIARAIAAGLTVAVVEGRMEFGPRALGHRSLLFDAARPELAERVGQALRRPAHMPFAPAVLAADLDRCVALPAALARTAEHMTVAVPATGWMRDRYPVAAHHDGTARVQSVVPERAPRLARILAALRAVTGTGLAINTSFNLHGEPIVAAPAEAVSTFLASGIDVLAIGDFVVRRPGGSSVSPGPSAARR